MTGTRYGTTWGQSNDDRSYFRLRISKSIPDRSSPNSTHLMAALERFFWLPIVAVAATLSIDDLQQVLVAFGLSLQIRNHTYQNRTLDNAVVTRPKRRDRQRPRDRTRLRTAACNALLQIRVDRMDGRQLGMDACRRQHGKRDGRRGWERRRDDWRATQRNIRGRVT